MSESSAPTRGRHRPNRGRCRPRGRRDGFPVQLLAAAAAAWVGGSALLFGTWPTVHGQLAIGQRAPATLVALTDFECADLARTESARQRAADAVPPVFTVSLSPLVSAAGAMVRLAGMLADLRQRDAPADVVRADLARSLHLLGADLTPEEAQLLVPEREAGAPVAERLTNALATVWMAGIVSPADRDGVIAELARNGKVVLDAGPSGPLRITDVESLRTPAEAAVAFADLVAASEAPLRAPHEALVRMGLGWMQPNLAYSPPMTAERRRQAAERAQVIPMVVRAGTTLIEAGDAATAQTVEMLAAHERRLRERMRPADEWLQRLGRSAFLAVAILCSLAMLPMLDPTARHGWKPSALYVVLVLLSIASARAVPALASVGLLPRPYVDFFLPTGLGALLAALLGGRPMAIAVGAGSALAAPLFATDPFHSLYRGAVVATAAILAGRHARRRSRIYRAGVWMGAVAVAFVVFEALLIRNPVRVAAAQAASVMATNIVVATATLALLPLLETAFGLTSDIHLLELSDPAHPLLQRLATEAPGTYHHSLMVANLAQAAADEIGANSLLARVGALYHDIGKLANPRYFIENVPSGANPHADLAPHMSTLVILSHVREGLTLARQYRLPAPIREAISQHHGSTTVSFFYSRALDAYHAAARLAPLIATPPQEDEYRYPGPRPASREVALIALADSVEAASRSLANPSPSRIERLVNDLLHQRLLDGELDDSPLTFVDLRRIARAFAFTLNSMYHGRIAYGSPEDSDRQPVGNAGARGAASAADGISDDSRRAAEAAQTMG